MNIHVLSGDSLVPEFAKTGIEGEMVVCRECLVDGELEADDLEGFWRLREKYLGETYSDIEGGYEEKVTNEFIRLWNLADRNDVNLWFENELFCQVNLWFTIWLLRNTDAKFFMVYPGFDDEDDILKGFAALDAEGLQESFNSRIKFVHDDVFLAIELWESFQTRDFEKMAMLGDRESRCFPNLKQVCEAAINIDTRPIESLKKIIADGKSEFPEAFRAFCEAEPIYGFGDLQVKRLYDEIKVGG